MKKKEGKFGLLKSILIFLGVAIILSWLIPASHFDDAGLIVSDGMMRIGLNDLSVIIYNEFYSFVLDKVIFLLLVGGLYGVLAKTDGYNRVVNSIAKTFSKNKKVFVVLISVLIAIFTSVISSTYVVILFIPFFVSILNRMKLDKMTIFATTFGSILVGIIGATFGTDGLTLFNPYLALEGQEVSDVIYSTILVRAGILVIGLALFNFFTLSHMSKSDASLEQGEEIFPVLEEETTKKKSAIPFIIWSVLLLVLVILGFMNWSDNFNIEIFNTFHDLVSNVRIGSDFYVLRDLLGQQAYPLGAWDLFTFNPILLLLIILIAVCYRVKFSEFVSNFAAGVKKMVKPCLFVLAAYTLMLIVYKSTYVTTILDKFLGLTDGFNLATTIMVSFITNIFHNADLGYSGFLLGSFFTAEYADYIKPVFVILTTIYGLVQFFIPTGIVLGTGLTTLNVKYSDWIKHIWKFMVGMFVCLLVIFILLTFI